MPLDLMCSRPWPGKRYLVKYIFSPFKSPWVILNWKTKFFIFWKGFQSFFFSQHRASGIFKSFSKLFKHPWFLFSKLTFFFKLIYFLTLTLVFLGFCEKMCSVCINISSPDSNSVMYISLEIAAYFSFGMSQACLCPVLISNVMLLCCILIVLWG